MQPTKSARDWEQLASSSHYQTAVAVDEALRRGDAGEAAAGIQELIDALARSEKRALRSQLTRLMLHIIKWRAQPESRSKSWRTSINQARREIAEIQEEAPSLNRAVIEDMWERCFDAAREQAEAEMDRESSVEALTWEDVFDTDYRVDRKS
jgi:hypothetical protein